MRYLLAVGLLSAAIGACGGSTAVPDEPAPCSTPAAGVVLVPDAGGTHYETCSLPATVHERSAIAAQCREGDAMMLGGCLVSETGSIVSSYPSVEGQATSWVCIATAPEQALVWACVTCQTK